MTHTVRRIVSGGQTGVDQAAFDLALELGIPIGGWVPHGRLAESGRIPERYSGLRETESDDPDVRTGLNVRDSDATLIISRGPLTGGSLLTRLEAEHLGRPILHLDLSILSLPDAAARTSEWLARVMPATLNVAGPRASIDPSVAADTIALLRSVLLRPNSLND